MAINGRVCVQRLFKTVVKYSTKLEAGGKLVENASDRLHAQIDGKVENNYAAAEA